jgi:hypothetical protein
MNVVTRRCMALVFIALAGLSSGAHSWPSGAPQSQIDALFRENKKPV